MPNNNKPLQLSPGTRYGMLVTVCQAPNVQGYTRWRVRCDCGAEAVVKAASLKSGKCQSCGCRNGKVYRDEYGNYDAQKGKQFRGLTVARATATPGADQADAFLHMTDVVITPRGLTSLADLWAFGLLRPVLWVEPGTGKQRFFLRAHAWGDGWQGWRVAKHLWDALVTEMCEEQGEGYDEWVRH